MRQKGHLLILIILLMNFAGFTQTAKYPFTEDILKFKSIDSASPPPQNAILFIGSSTFTKWTDVDSYFPGYTIINRAFGASTVANLLHYSDELLNPYHPRQVVIYCGENDFAASDSITPEIVNNRFVALYTLIRSRIPDAKITYVSMKPSPKRWYLKDKYIVSNNFIHKFLKKQHNTSYVDIWSKMLDKNKQPMAGIFTEDQLHINAEGYQILQKAIKPHLIK
jgi:lysophospholipase L1-like esterase